MEKSHVPWLSYTRLLCRPQSTAYCVVHHAQHLQDIACYPIRDSAASHDIFSRKQYKGDDDIMDPSKTIINPSEPSRVFTDHFTDHFVFLFFLARSSRVGDIKKIPELHMQGVILHHRATLCLQRATTKDTQIKNI